MLSTRNKWVGEYTNNLMEETSITNGTWLAYANFKFTSPGERSSLERPHKSLTDSRWGKHMSVSPRTHEEKLRITIIWIYELLKYTWKIITENKHGRVDHDRISHILSQISRLRGQKEGHKFPQTCLLLRSVLQGASVEESSKRVKEKQILIQPKSQSSALPAKTILSFSVRRTNFTSTEL
jgi:hypothetical protein